MNELPPDPARLRAILRYLDQQITDNDTIGIYLRLQRDAVRQALGETDAPPAPAPAPRRANGRLPKGAKGLPSFAAPASGRQTSRFVVERQSAPSARSRSGSTSTTAPAPSTAARSRRRTRGRRCSTRRSSRARSVGRTRSWGWTWTERAEAPAAVTRLGLLAVRVQDVTARAEGR